VPTVSKVAVDINRHHAFTANCNILRALVRRGRVKNEKSFGLHWLEIPELPPDGEGGTR
jgi:hypothetical protein